MNNWDRHPGAWVFAILWASYGFFWQGRDWNSSSRLMLTYAMVDRGTVRIDGLEDQTRDLARYRGHWYTDKTPGFSIAAIPAYWLAKTFGHLPDHPIDRKGFAHWPADYWITWGTSGLCTAITGAILAAMALRLGCGPRQAGLLGLAYGLATPASVYATLAYGHQLAAFGLFAAFALIVEPGPRVRVRAALAGFLAAYASVVEIQVGPVSAILGLTVLGLALAGRIPNGALVAFVLGASVPTLVLLGYNQVAFESPWKMGYFFLVMDRFKEVHSTDNPLGLTRPDLAKLRELLWGERRGLVRFAPILALAPLGWALLLAQRRWLVAGLIGSISVAVLLVNLSYPEWTGGWTTGPRLLVPMLPFACLAVAPLLAANRRIVLIPALILGILGGVEMLLFEGVGGRIPDYIDRPFVDGVWPIWRGDRLPGWVFGQRFAHNLASLTMPEVERKLPPGFGFLTFAPLVGFQALAIAAMCSELPRTAERRSTPVDQAEAA